MGGRKDLITAGLTLGALADAAKAKGKMSAIIATESGAVASFPDGTDAPVADLTAAIVPVQSGSGDPSPTNIRQISGWTECKVYRSGADTSDPTIYTVTFGSAGTVYGGTLDVTTGTLTVEKAVKVFSGKASEAWYKSDYNYFSCARIADAVDSNASPDTFMSNLYKYGNIANTTSNLGGCLIWQQIRVRLSDMSGTADDWKASLALQPLQVVYTLAEPLVYNLTPVEIRTLVGQNTIWADTGDVTVKYTADTKAFIDNYIAARRNG